MSIRNFFQNPFKILPSPKLLNSSVELSVKRVLSTWILIVTFFCHCVEVMEYGPQFLCFLVNSIWVFLISK